jgi:hypothetical protein
MRKKPRCAMFLLPAATLAQSTMPPANVLDKARFFSNSKLPIQMKRLKRKNYILTSKCSSSKLVKW